MLPLKTPRQLVQVIGGVRRQPVRFLEEQTGINLIDIVLGGNFSKHEIGLGVGRLVAYYPVEISAGRLKLGSQAFSILLMSLPPILVLVLLCL